VTAHTASCRCGQLTATATGEPVRVSVCHCLDCQRRSGSAFAAQVRFPAEQVTIAGNSTEYAHAGGGGNIARFHFCPTCGDSVYFTNDTIPETIAIALGTLANPYAFTPNFSVWENRKHDWIEITGDGIEHD